MFDVDTVLAALQEIVPADEMHNDMNINVTKQFDYADSRDLNGYLDDRNRGILSVEHSNGEDISNLTATLFYMGYPSYPVAMFSSFPIRKNSDGTVQNAELLIPI